MKNAFASKTMVAMAAATVMLLAAAIAPISASALDDNRMVWLTTRTSAAQETMSNNDLDSGDMIVYHFGLNADPTTAQLTDLNDVTSVPDNRKGLEFFSLAELEEHAPTVAAQGFGFISYDLESVSPDAEEADPVGSVIAAKEIADNNGIDLMVAPSHAITTTYSDDIAPYVDRYHLQSQPKQDDDTTCDIMLNWINQEITDIEGANSALAGEITAQVTITGNAASGKTAYETAEDCIDRSIVTGDGHADGVTIFWNAATFDDGSYETLLQYFETNYS